MYPTLPRIDTAQVHIYERNAELLRDSLRTQLQL